MWKEYEKGSFEHEQKKFPVEKIVFVLAILFVIVGYSFLDELEPIVAGKVDNSTPQQVLASHERGLKCTGVIRYGGHAGVRVDITNVSANKPTQHSHPSTAIMVKYEANKTWLYSGFFKDVECGNE